MPDKIYFCTLSPHFPLAGVSFQCEPLSPALNFPNSPRDSPNSRWNSSSSPLPSLCLLHPPSWDAARGAGSGWQLQPRGGVSVSVNPQEHWLKEQQQRQGEVGSLYQAASASPIVKVPAIFVCPHSLSLLCLCDTED